MKTLRYKDGEVITSRQSIKSFPFTPKTFYVNVRSVEVEKEGYDTFLDDESQLEEIFEYYDRYSEGGK